MMPNVSHDPTLPCPKFGLSKPKARKRPVKKAIDKVKESIPKIDPLGIIGECSAKAKLATVIRALKIPIDKGSEEESENKEAYREARYKRWDHQRTLIRLFRDLLTPNESTWGFHTCKKSPIFKKPSKKEDNGVDIIHSPLTGFSSYKGLQSCDRPSCVHCAEAKAINDKKYLEAMRACHLRAGGSIIMMTLTNSHYEALALKDQLEGQKIAVDKLNQWLSKSHFFDEFGGRVGIVRAWEKTYGKHGWHPHFHFLIYMNDDLIERDENGEALEDQPTLMMIRNSIAEEWIKACEKAGLPAPDYHIGVDVRDGTHASNYVGKYGDEVITMKGGWGSDEEMSKPHLKVDKEAPKSLADALKGDKGLTPWQLLELAHNGDKKAGDLYVEYAYAIFGTAQLYWYPKTKDSYDLDAEIEARRQEQLALTAQQFDDNIIPEDFLFISVGYPLWAGIAHCNAMPHLLTATEKDIENGDFEKKRNTWALINHCSKVFQAHLVEQAKNQAIIAPESIEKKIKGKVVKRYGKYGSELLSAIQELQRLEFEKIFGSPVVEEVPDWISNVPISDNEMPPNHYNYNYEDDFECWIN